MSPAKETIMGPSSGQHARAIVFVGPQQNFAECIETALKHEIAELDVVRSGDFLELFEDIDDVQHRADLIIVDETLYDEVPSHLDQLRQHFPTQVICVAFNKAESLTGYMNGSGLHGVIHSFLPMNLRLDIWLSAVQLMINGGEYIPPQFLTAGHIEPHGEGINGTSPLDSRRRAPRQGNGVSRGDRLTAREIDVLKLVAKGYQNKVVAAELDLSEHTIKLHMHHIIAKLGASNRTEAAAIYFDKIEADKANGTGAK